MTATIRETPPAKAAETDAGRTKRWRGAWVLLGITLVALAIISVANWWLVYRSGIDQAAAIEAQPPLGYMFRYASLEYYGNVLGFGPLLMVSALVLWLDRTNTFGWLMGAGVIAWMIANLMTVLFAVTVDRDPTSPSLPFLAWTLVTSMMVFPALLAVSIAFFPNGRITASGWWRRLLQIALAFGFTVLVGARFLPGPIATDPTDPVFNVDNPFGLPIDEVFSLELAVFGALILTIFTFASLVTTYVRSAQEARHQIKWIVAMIPFQIVGQIIISFIDAPWETIPSGIGIMAFAGVFALAVTKRNLYGIDIIISKALVFTALAGFIGVVYVSVVVGVGSLLGQGDEPSTVLSVAATAIVAVAFQPVRRWFEHVANRVVFGRKATPYQVLSEFSRRVAATSDDLLDDAARSLAEGTRAERVSISVLSDGEPVEAAAWPPESGVGSSNTVSFPITDGDTLLGSLDLHLSAGADLAEDDQRLASQLASGMGLALRNQLLTENLEARVDDLRRSRRRLVALQDETRRRIERDLHDGAQQQLVALKVKLGLGRAIAAKEGAVDTAATLERLAAQADRAVDAMREFARGVYPPLLEAEGLTSAIGAQLRRAPIPVTMTADGIDRYPREIESTIYFCVLEALRNTVRHADATSATIDLTQPNGSVIFEVTDDGRGFDPSSGLGAGLTAISDRVDALTGTFMVYSESGRGTRIVGSLPAHAEGDAS